MANHIGDLRTCPTRIDGAATLFAHRVTRSQCTDRQRGSYHKCFTCAYSHAQVQAHGLPSEGSSAEGRAPGGGARAVAEVRALEGSREARGPRPVGDGADTLRAEVI